ncbi:MAG TPA: flagellar basal body P-ring protein FlgI [Polyangiaceae bacterium]|nr:flagellar basal body P-ring protein FlgI [Polyangiaceae bacterium]
MARRRWPRRAFGLVLTLAVLLGAAPARADRLLDLCDVVGVRENQLVGYGVVVGLQGTGDDVSAPFAMQSLRSLLRRLGVQIDSGQLRLRNVAAVLVTANIPAFVRSGGRLDITVASVGNARSLRGGVLAQTPMRGADRRVYAAAQGPLIVGGYEAGGAGGGVQAATTNTARIPGGALVEREIETAIEQDGALTLALKAPNFLTAQRVVEAVNAQLGQDAARAVDAGSVEVKVSVPGEAAEKQDAAAAAKPDPKAKKTKEQLATEAKEKAEKEKAEADKRAAAAVSLLAKLTTVEVAPDTSARVIINERTGTVVAGGDVRLLPVAIAQGGITIAVRERAEVSQPGPLSNGQTAVVTQTDVEAKEPTPQVAYLDGAASLADVAKALSSFGVSPRELASILQALRTAGALRAEIIVQ